MTAQQTLQAALKGRTKAAAAPQEKQLLPDGFQAVVQIGNGDFLGLGIGTDFQSGAFEVLNIRRMFIPRGEERFQPSKAGISIPTANPAAKAMIEGLKAAKLL